MDAPTTACQWSGCPQESTLGVIAPSGTVWLCTPHCDALRRYGEREHGGDLCRAAQRCPALPVRLQEVR